VRAGVGVILRFGTTEAGGGAGLAAGDARAGGAGLEVEADEAGAAGRGVGVESNRDAAEAGVRVSCCGCVSADCCGCDCG